MLESSTCTKQVAQVELLVVDDDQGQLQSLQQLLHISGYTNVALASGGDEAIRKLQNNALQLILLDLQMPGTNGLNVLEFHRHAGLDSEIIIISGKTSFPWVKEAMRLGAHDFIRKPYKPEELLTAIEKALDQFQEKRHQRAVEKFNAKPATETDILSPEAIKRSETKSGFPTLAQGLTYPQAFFSAFFKQANYLAGVLDRDMRLLEVNPRALEVIGRPAQVVIGQPFINTPWWREEDKPRLNEALVRAAAGQADTFVATHPTTDGHALSVQFSVLPVNVGDELYVAVTGLDISERIQHQHKLVAQRRRLSDILEGTHVGTWKWNVQTGETLFSERWAEITGYRLAELEPVSIETWKQLVHPYDLIASRALLEKHFRGESPYYEFETRMRHKDGHWVWVLDRGMISTWTDDGRPLLMSGINQDITERKLAQWALEKKTIELQTKNRLLDTISKTDQLTGIANRRGTQQVIEQEIDRLSRYKKPFCIFQFDIDHFKTVNDTHGHEVGDQVLVELVRLVQSEIRRTDTLGRWGGEEFILVCPETSLPTAQTIAGKICTTVREHEFTRGLGITLSIGVSEFQCGATLKDILVEVDQKMYLAKQNGRDRVEA